LEFGGNLPSRASGISVFWYKGQRLRSYESVTHCFTPLHMMFASLTGLSLWGRLTQTAQCSYAVLQLRFDSCSTAVRLLTKGH